MALNISLKPRERLVVNGAVIRNKSARHPLSIEFLNRVNFMREREILLPEHAVTPLLRVIYWLQISYIDPEQRAIAQARFLELAHDLHAAVAVPGIRSALDSAVDFMLAGRFGAALKLLRDVLPLEQALLDLADQETPGEELSGIAEAIGAVTPAADGLAIDVNEEPFDSAP